MVSLLILTLGSLAGAPSSHSDPALVASRPIEALMVGNSYTFFNEMPRILEQFSVEAKLKRPIKCTLATVGGATLEGHWNNEEFRKLLISRKWDFVILQEQSLRPITEPELFHKYAGLWCKEIRTAGAQALFYMTWARKATPEKQSAYTDNYRKAAGENGAEVAPVGEAWRAVREARPDIELFSEDGSHPSPAGSYLAACSLYVAVTGSSPLGLPSKLEVKDGDGKPKTLVDMKPEVAKFLQQSAWDAAQREKATASKQKT
jgi:hypothetical protein